MARVAMTDDEALSLNGATDTVNKAGYPTIGSYDYGADLLRLLSRTLELAGLPGGGWFEVGADDASAVSVFVGAGKAVVAGTPVSYAGEVIDLASYGNDVVYVWLAPGSGGQSGEAVVVTGTDAAGWPALGNAHVRLAEVTIADGAISGIVDWRGALLFGVS